MKLGLERRGFFIVVTSDKEMDLNEECSLRDSWILVLNSFFLRCCFDGGLLIILLFIRCMLRFSGSSLSCSPPA